MIDAIHSNLCSVKWNVFSVLLPGFFISACSICHPATALYCFSDQDDESIPVSTLLLNSIAIGSAENQNAQTFSPTSLSGLVLWLRADSISSRPDGSGVGSWLDDSGNNNDALQGAPANQPGYYSSQVNGLPIVSFDAFNDDLVLNSAVVGANLTVIAVIKNRTTLAGLGIILGSPGGHTISYRWAGLQPFVYDDPGSFNSGGVNYEDTTPRIFTATLNGTVSRSWHTNGTQITPGGDSHSGSSMLLERVGARGGNYGGAGIAEIIAYTRTISDSERRQVECYLNSKYGISVFHSCGS